jgi:membrane protein implicated in regulation of membrane protease activity
MIATAAPVRPARFSSAAFKTLMRWLGLGLILVAGMVLLAFAAAAAAIIAFVVLAAALALQLAPRASQPESEDGGDVLEARRTPSGWEVETRARS